MELHAAAAPLQLEIQSSSVRNKRVEVAVYENYTPNNH
jgi:hypothetical protein